MPPSHPLKVITHRLTPAAAGPARQESHRSHTNHSHRVNRRHRIPASPETGGHGLGRLRGGDRQPGGPGRGCDVEPGVRRLHHAAGADVVGVDVVVVTDHVQPLLGVPEVVRDVALLQIPLVGESLPRAPVEKPIVEHNDKLVREVPPLLHDPALDPHLGLQEHQRVPRRLRRRGLPVHLVLELLHRGHHPLGHGLVVDGHEVRHKIERPPRAVPGEAEQVPALVRPELRLGGGGVEGDVYGGGRGVGGDPGHGRRGDGLAAGLGQALDNGGVGGAGDADGAGELATMLMNTNTSLVAVGVAKRASQDAHTHIKLSAFIVIPSEVEKLSSGDGAVHRHAEWQVQRVHDGLQAQGRGDTGIDPPAAH
mmetsp:Transcript_42006/g.101032  ORF Transcript_42006/g.101032 Transcript_42006/m.101032 type:complete len:366 (+) Transcript_42006:265-1362(+)